MFRKHTDAADIRPERHLIAEATDILVVCCGCEKQKHRDHQLRDRWTASKTQAAMSA